MARARWKPVRCWKSRARPELAPQGVAALGFVSRRTLSHRGGGGNRTPLRHTAESLREPGPTPNTPGDPERAVRGVWAWAGPYPQ